MSCVFRAGVSLCVFHGFAGNEDVDIDLLYFLTPVALALIVQTTTCLWTVYWNYGAQQ